jgi:hypothetical protein
MPDRQPKVELVAGGPLDCPPAASAALSAMRDCTLSHISVRGADVGDVSQARDGPFSTPVSTEQL